MDGHTSESTEETSELPTNEQPKTVIAAPPKKRPRKAIVIVSVVVLAAAAAGCWFLLHRPTPAPTPLQPIAKKDAVFYDVPRQQADLGLFKSAVAAEGIDCSDPNADCASNNDRILYYQIGSVHQRPVVVAFVDSDAVENSVSYLFLGKNDGTYALLANMTLDSSDASYQDSLKQIASPLTGKASIDTTTKVSQLDFAHTVTVAGQKLTSNIDSTRPVGYFINGLDNIRGNYFDTPVAQSQRTKLLTQDGVTYYEVTVPGIGDRNYKVHEFYGVVGGVYAASYSPAEVLSSDTPSTVDWTTGKEIGKVKYTYSATGCGSATGFVTATDVQPSQLTVTGSGPDGATIYQLSSDSQLFKEYYAEYGTGEDTDDSSLKNLSVSQYQANHALVLIKNSFGEYVAYQRSDLANVGGCGKPVVYLYPTKTTNVSVSVGATVTASSPTYTKNGWQNVTAQPSGELTYHGAGYDSLFWEGVGHGSYPLITTGTVVPSGQAVATIRQQLHAQGLNDHETAEFIAFWQSRLPHTPYVRLSWLTMPQINELAPLRITPAPTTMIRVFLDFQGLSSWQAIAPQTFQAMPRRGFTAVEWGGLLHK